MFPWGLLGSGLKAGFEIYQNKKKSEVAMSEAALLHAEKMKRGEIEYQGKVFENQKNDWKDEFILLTPIKPSIFACIFCICGRCRYGTKIKLVF